jgi:hypothetical protein
VDVGEEGVIDRCDTSGGKADVDVDAKGLAEAVVAPKRGCEDPNNDDPFDVSDIYSH